MALRGVCLALPAALALASAAAAADLPLLAEPVDYVAICDAYGTGYLRVPGTETCLRIRSRVRTDYNLFFDLDDEAFDIEPSRGFDTSGKTGYRFRARSFAYVDWRTPTPLGDLRLYSELRYTLDNGGSTVADLHQAYIRLGGFKFGRAYSYYDFFGILFSQFEFFDPQFSRNNPQLMLAYEAELGGRYSAALSIEDNTGRRVGITNEFLSTQYGGAQIPDIVVHLKANTEDDPWYAQLMGATHYVNAVTQGIGHTDALGFALGAGVAANVPLGRGTRVGLTSSFARGALNFASTSASAPYGLAADGVFDNATNEVSLSRYVTVAVGGKTDLAPQVELALQAGFLYGDLPTAATDFNGDGADDDLDFVNLDLQAFLKWQPFDGFFVGAGAEYRFVDTADFGNASFLTTYIRAQSTF